MSHYLIYKTTNLVNGNIYVGKHITSNINDGYIGSGKRLKSAIKKYGVDSFRREIIKHCADELEMNYEESILVTEEFCARPDTYNLCPGGNGGFGYINQNKLNDRTGQPVSEETKLKISKAKRGKKFAYRPTTISKERLKEIHKKISDTAKGQTKSKDHKDAISKALLGRKYETTKCPHCDTTGASHAMKRWHFDNCKMLA